MTHSLTYRLCGSRGDDNVTLSGAKLADILYAAAEYVEDDAGLCYAIAEAVARSHDADPVRWADTSTVYQELARSSLFAFFGPGPDDEVDEGRRDYWFNPETPDRTERRLLSLGLMLAAVESGQ
jgi:hypothetical protein